MGLITEGFRERWAGSWGAGPREDGKVVSSWRKGPGESPGTDSFLLLSLEGETRSSLGREGTLVMKPPRPLYPVAS